MDAATFLANLREEVEAHPGVNHPLLARAAQVPFTIHDFKVLGLQHFALVGEFTSYMEMLLLRAPDSDAKQWMAKVLVDEYGERSEDKDHTELYLDYLRAAGIAEGEEERTPLHVDVMGFVKEHRRICREEPFLVGLGAVGPGHEWAIPKMFPPIVKGLRRAGFDEEGIFYWTAHMEQDIDHGNWLQEALERFSHEPKEQSLIRRGALLSLEARSRFWSAVQEKIVRWRQPRNLHLRQAQQGSGERELVLPKFRRRLGRPLGAVAA